MPLQWRVHKRNVTAVLSSFLFGAWIAFVFLPGILLNGPVGHHDAAPVLTAEAALDRKVDDAAPHLPQRKIAELPEQNQEQEDEVEEEDDEEEGPLVCVVYNPEYELDTTQRYKHRITAFNEGRLGNQLFLYAAILGTARRNYLNPVITTESLVRKAFNVTTQHVYAVDTLDWPTYTEGKAYTFNVCIKRLNYEMDIRLIGYYHSWRYFEYVEDELRSQLQFLPWVEKSADLFYKSVLSEFYGRNRSVITVGIHLRLGDYAFELNKYKGYVEAPMTYIETAMTYFMSMDSPQDLLFVVCSDDMMEARLRIQSLRHLGNVPTIFVDQRAFDLELPNQAIVPDIESPEVHLRILSLCNHVITTSGSFSWWAGWFSKGTVLYYSRFPLPDSPLDREFVRYDYYPKHWIGLP